MKRAIIIVLIFAVYFIVGHLLPLSSPDGLTPAGQKMIALMLCIVITWVSEVVPILVSCITFMFMVFFIGVTTPEVQVAKDFANPTVFFVFSSMLFAYALDFCGLNKRIALKLTVLSRGKPKLLLLYMMAGCAALSAVISNIPACASFFFIAMALIKTNKLEKKKSNYSKALILGVVLAAMVGGNITPAGSSLNVLALQLLSQTTEQLTGVATTMRFIDWTMIGLPLTIIAIPMLWFVTLLVFKPEITHLAGIEDTKQQLKELGSIKAAEWKFIVLTVILLGIWLTQGILHNVPVATTAAFVTTLYFFPGINILNYQYILDKLDWTLIIMIGVSGTFGAGMTKTGAALWMANGILGPFADSSFFVLMCVVVIFTVLIHIVVPSNPALVGILVPTFAAYAVANSIDPMLLFLPFAFTVSASWFFPFDPVPILTWPEGYYSMGDFFKVGVVAHIFMAALVIVWMVVYCKPLGFITG